MTRRKRPSPDPDAEALAEKREATLDILARHAGMRFALQALGGIRGSALRREASRDEVFAQLDEKRQKTALCVAERELCGAMGRAARKVAALDAELDD